MKKAPPFEDTVLEKICEILGHTDTGLTGSEIGRLLHAAGIADVGPSTKRWRLYEALRRQQEKDQSGGCVVDFIKAAMNPVRYADAPYLFEQRRSAINKVLAFVGYELREDGKIYERQLARTLSEAEGRAERLRGELERRGVHQRVLEFCRAELLQENYFHAVLEATKSVAERIRTLTGLKEDGAKLVDLAFGLERSGKPLLTFNSLQTETERSEHEGLRNLMKGVFGVFRNPTAHAPRISWIISEQDALDLLSIISYLHRRLDKCQVNNSQKL